MKPNIKPKITKTDAGYFLGSRASWFDLMYIFDFAYRSGHAEVYDDSKGVCFMHSSHKVDIRLIC